MRKAAKMGTGILFSLVLAALPVLGEGFSIEQALSYPFPYGLTAAAHGERIAWVFDLRGARNVWVADGPDFAARQVTHYKGDDGMPIASLQLTPDGNTIVYARGSETNDQGEVADPTSNVDQPQQQVWAVEVSGGEPRLLGTMNCSFEGCEDIEISPDGQYAVWSARHQLWIAPVSGKEAAHRLAYIRGDNSHPRWSPDGKKIAFVSNRGTHSLIGIYEFGSQTLRYADPSVFRDALPHWSRDGSKLAFIRVSGAGGGFLSARVQPWAIWVWNATNGEAKQIWQSTNDANGSFPGGEPEQAAFQFAAGNRIIFASEEDGWVHLYSIPADGGAPLLLTPGAFSFEDVTLAADGKSLVYSSNDNDIDRRHIWRVPVDRADKVALTHGESIEWTPVVTGDGRFVLCLGSTATQPAMPYRITQQGREMVAASALPADYPSPQLVVPKQVIFKSLDGLEIHGQLFVPRGQTKPGPALVFTHGGPPRQMLLGFHPMDAYNFMYAANEYLASRGYVVLSVNYRLSIMYGRAFRVPAHAGPQGASEYQDVVAGAKYLQSLPYVDPGKIGLWGGSYGGYLTAMGLARNSDIFKAGVDYAGVHDFSAFLGGRGGAGGADDLRKVAYESSPVASIDKWKSPVLLIQADDDRNVPFSQTSNLVPMLREHHIPYELMIFPDEVHDSLLWQTWVRVFAATGDFFDRTLVKGEAIQTIPPEN
ncbi:MAG TPA: prolyl oligopeptidase family serine peptidase [Terriglobales bacterium]|nr:prolyl oligopeptidase family serine peptidase [Terriglobales bacterium]